MRDCKLDLMLNVAWMVLILFSSNVFASENTDDLLSKETNNTYQLDEIVVSATRAQTPKQDVAANITVVDREAIEKMPAATVAEVLQYVPGVSVEFEGNIGSKATVRIQGSETRQVAVYMDGVPLNMLANPSTDLNYVPVNIIERIEVYKGAASSAWGSSLGGVINIITIAPDASKPFSANVRTSYGKSDTSKSRGNISGTKDQFGYFLSLTHDRSDGFADNSAYDQTTAYGKVNYDINDASRVNFVYSYDGGKNEDPLLTDPDDPTSFTWDFWDDIKQKRTYQRLLFETFYSDNLSLTVEGRHHDYDNKIEDVFVDHRETYSDYDEESWGGSVKVNYLLNPENTVNLGFDGDWGEFDWNNYDKTYDTGNWAVYANDTFNRGNYSLNAGLRYDDNQDFGSEVSPSAGAVYRMFDDRMLIRAQVAKGFSAPPGAWVKDPTYGNPDLDPEAAVNYQLGTDVRFCKIFLFELNLFYADVDDLIQYDPDTRKYGNIDKVTRKGVEGTLSAAFDFGLDVSVSGSFTDVEDDKTNEEIKDIPTEQYQVFAGYTWEWMTHSIFGKYTDYNSTYPETKDKKFVFDYKFKAKLPEIKYLSRAELFCSVYNLFNSNTVYREVWPQPDRWAEAGVSLAF